MVFVSLLVLVACCVSVISANEKPLCLTETRSEGDIEFTRNTVNHTKERCVVIRYTEGSEIELTLVNMTRENTSGTGRCYSDYVEIFDKVRNRSAKYCVNEKNRIKKIQLFHSNEVMIIYKASSSNELHDSAIKQVGIHYRRATPTKSCRHILKGETGQFQSPGYPSYFAPGIECEWTITTHQGRVIVLQFHHLQLWGNCETDFIEVHDGENDKSPMKICDNDQFGSIPMIRSKTPKLWLKMKSTTDSVNRFRATYKTIPGCQVDVKRGKAVFEAPKTLPCKTWNLTAVTGHIAALSIKEMNLVSTDSTICSGNVVEVWDGKQTAVYCNLNNPPTIITSKGRTLVVTYRSTKLHHISTNTFHASFISILPSSYKSNCFVYNNALSFQCNDHRAIIPCDMHCDGNLQCYDKSDEDSCPDMEAKWHKLEVFVIIMGSICASTVIFCVGLVCFRKFILRSEHVSDSYGRRCSVSDNAPLTPNADLPSPPPGYFNDNDNIPPSITRGTYFFGNEFSQSGIHSASLFGIPPPRYHSTESLNQPSVNSTTRSLWQGGLSDIPLVETNVAVGDIENRQELVESHTPEDDPPNYDSIEEDKDNQKSTSSRIENNEISQPSDESTQTINSGHASTGFSSNIDNADPDTGVGITNIVAALYV